MMWQSFIIVAVGVTLLMLARRGWGVFVRRRATSRLTDPLVRETRGVRVAGLLEGLPSMGGMNPRRRNLMVGDLVMSADRFILACNRGLLADIGPDHGRKFSSVRCTGPGRLVIEGHMPSPRGGQGLYRFEISTEDAVQWAEALQPFVDASLAGEGPKYATKPPGM